MALPMPGILATPTGPTNDATATRAPGAGSATETAIAEPLDVALQVSQLFPWLPAALVQIYSDAWVEYGDANRALAVMRQDPSYEVYFPGNTRADGTLQYSEQEYLAVVDGFDEILVNAGVNPDLFSDSYGDLIAGSTSLDEFRYRVDGVIQGVINNIPQVEAAFAQLMGMQPGDIPLEAYVAMALDPTIGVDLVDRNISLAQITAEASSRGFTITPDFSQALLNFGVDQAAARTTFTSAAGQLPFLQALASRHYDPDDTFSLSEFVDLDVYEDATQQQRVQSLLSQERSLFREVSGVAATEEGLTGLTAG